MIKEALFTLIGSGVLAVCKLQAQAVTTPMVTLKQPRFNIGVKAGFNSSMFFTDEISINGKELELAQNNYKVGYFAAVFCRFNKASFHPAGVLLQHHTRKCLYPQHIGQLGNPKRKRLD